MNFKNCYTLSIFICLFLTSIPLYANLVPERILASETLKTLVPERILEPEIKSTRRTEKKAEKATSLTMLGKSFGGYGLGLVTSSLILAAFCNASKTSHDSMSYIALGLLSSFAGGSLANFCAHRYPKQTAWIAGGLLSTALVGAPICYTLLDLFPVADQVGFFTNYPSQK
jgi:hypothetical protein